jgi:hypothetical protein
MVFSGFMPGNLGNYPVGGFFIPDHNITITRMSASENAIGGGCSSDAGVLLWNWQTFANIYQLDLLQGVGYIDSGPLSISIPAGRKIVIQGGAASGCTPVTGQSPSDVFVNVQYVML